MIQNHRPYQWMYSKTGNRFLAAAAGLGARICGSADLTLHSLGGRAKDALPTPAEARAALEQLYPKPLPETPPPPLPPAQKDVDLSIVIPAYNAEKYIEDCLQSILQQKTTYTMQIIVVEDGSQDRTVELLEKYRSLPQVVVTAGAGRGGAARARNTGLLQAVGRWVLFVDSDDQLLPGAIQTLLDAAAQTGAEIVQGGWQYVDDAGTRGLKQEYARRTYTGAKRLDRLDLPGMPWGKVYRRELFEKIRFPSHYSCFEDTNLHCLVFRLAETVASVPEVVYLWRKNPEGLTATNQHRPAAVQSYWIMEEMLAQDAALGLPHDALFEAVVTMQLSNFCYANVSKAPETVQKNIFVLCCALYAKALPQGIGPGQSCAVRYGARALERRDFALWRRQGQRFQLL